MKRRRLTQRQKAAILDAQEMICACGCGLSLVGRDVQFDHVRALGLLGADDPGNIRALLPEHHKVKTADDIRRIRKADRQRRYMETGKGRARRGRKLPSRPFQGWRRFDGTPMKRER